MTCSPFDSNPTVASVVTFAGITEKAVIGDTTVVIQGVSRKQ